MVQFYKRLILDSSVEAPLSYTVYGILRLSNPCLYVSPLSKNTVIRKFDLAFNNGLNGAVLSGLGDTKVIEREARYFGFTYDIEAARDFIRNAVNQAFRVINHYPRGYLVFAYVPRGAWIEPVDKCKEPVKASSFKPIPPPEDVDSALPRRIGDAVIHRNDYDVGVLAIAVSPVYVYLVLAYGLTIIPRHPEPRIAPQLQAKAPGEAGVDVSVATGTSTETV